MNLIWTIIIGLGTSFIGSMLGFVVAIHFDLEGFWQQRHIERGRKIEEKKRKQSVQAQGKVTAEK